MGENKKRKLKVMDIKQEIKNAGIYNESVYGDYINKGNLVRVLKRGKEFYENQYPKLNQRQNKAREVKGKIELLNEFINALK